MLVPRDAALRFISGRYFDVHDADPEIPYRDLIVVGGPERVTAACGYRRASAGPLFLEAYLDQPVEQALRCHCGLAVARRDIVEIGNLAAETAPAMIALWARAANDLGGDAEIAVAVLTRPLRDMFARLGVSLVEMVPARPDRLGDEAARWGRYYALDPVVCVGSIAEGQQRLARFAARARRVPA